MSDDSRLREIEERWAEAVPGPWKVVEYDHVTIRGSRDELILSEPMGFSETSGSWPTGDATDATYRAVAAAPEDVAWLIARVRELESR